MPGSLQILLEENYAAEGAASANPFADDFTYETLPNGMPILHGYPSAPASIYLDFDGGVYHGNTTHTGYDVDGDFSTFNTTEQATIVEAWRQMSVYFAMFNVNVTTIQPSSSTPKAWLLVGNDVSGGTSYVDVFPRDRAESRNASSHARTRVSALAHEIGHNFGNWHTSAYDNLGNQTAEYHNEFDPLHGPIMGLDYRGVIHKWTIWHSSTDVETLQDDMARIAQDLDNYGGDGYRSDDYGGTIAAATPLTTVGNTQAIVGIVERLNDADAFSFTSEGGRYAVSVGRDAPSGVDVKVSIYDAAGTLIATEDGDPRQVPYTMVNDAHLTLDLDAGAYYVVVESHGNYGDQGQYIVHVDPMADQWNSEAIGLVGVLGYTGYDAATETYTVAGSGSDIWGTADEFQFLYQTLEGDGSITARVASLENTDTHAKAGVMIRESLDAGSRNAMIEIKPAGTTHYQRRTGTNGSSTSTTGPTGYSWVRLTRVGNVITAYVSTDGTSWTQVGSQTIAMGSKVYIGLATTSHNNVQLNTATFTDVTLTGNLNPQPTLANMPAPPGLSASAATNNSVTVQWGGIAIPGDINFDRAVDAADLAFVKSNFGGSGAGDVNGDGVVDIIDYNTVKNNLGMVLEGYVIERSTDGVNFTPVGETNSQVIIFTDTGLSDFQRYFYRVRARSGTDVSPASEVVSTVTQAGAISNLNIISSSTSQLILDWTDASGETNYRIQRSNDGQSGWITRGTVGRNVPMFTDNGLSTGATYYYRVQTLQGGVVTVTSVVVSVSTQSSAAEAPTAFAEAASPPNAADITGTSTANVALDFGTDSPIRVRLESNEPTAHFSSNLRMLAAATIWFGDSTDLSPEMNSRDEPARFHEAMMGRSQSQPTVHHKAIDQFFLHWGDVNSARRVSDGLLDSLRENDEGLSRENSPLHRDDWFESLI